MSRTLYSFEAEAKCHACGVRLNGPGSVQYAQNIGDQLSVNPDGVVQLHTGADLILTNPEPELRCAYCSGPIAYAAIEEA